MKKSKQILDQVAQKIAQSPNNSTTPAGLHKQNKALSPEQKQSLAISINESFEILRINYNHLYFSAYSEIDALNAAKRLWIDSLQNFAPEVILQAIHKLIKTSDYLPTISRVIRQCMELSQTSTLPNAHSAYVEASTAASPKCNVQWSHPAVYYAGRKSEWRFLESTNENVAFPIFKANYEAICQRVLEGEELPPINPLSLPDNSDQKEALSKTENSERMKTMRAELGI